MASPAGGKAGSSWGRWKGSASYCIWQYGSSTSTCIKFFCQTMSPIFFLFQLRLPKCRWMGNIVDWNFLKFSPEINMLQLYLKGPDFPSWATLAEVKGLQVHPTVTLGCESLRDILGFSPPPFTARPLLWELGIPDYLWSQLFAKVSSYSFSHTTALVLAFKLSLLSSGEYLVKVQTHQHRWSYLPTKFSGSI